MKIRSYFLFGLYLLNHILNLATTDSRDRYVQVKTLPYFKKPLNISILGSQTIKNEIL